MAAGACSCCSSVPVAPRSFTKSSGSSCCNCRSGRRRSRSACCWGFTWAACVSAVCCCRDTSLRTSIRLRVYAYLELGIGAFGVVVLYAVPCLGDLYTEWAGTRTGESDSARDRREHLPAPADAADGRDAPGDRALASIPRRAACRGSATSTAAISLGAVGGQSARRLLPAARVRHADGDDGRGRAERDRGGHRACSSPAGSTPAFASARAAGALRVRGNRLVYVAIALSGLTALGAEVVWTRLLSLLFGATTYTFSLILAVFLMGLGIGSSIGAAMARRFGELAGRRSAVCQLLLCGAIAWAAHTTGDVDAVLADQSVDRKNPVYQFDLDLLRGVLGRFCRARSCGAPVSRSRSAAAAREGEDTGRLVGGVYAANTVGAIVGALVTSLILVAAVGSQRAQQMLIGISAVAGLLMLATPPPMKARGRRSAPRSDCGLAPVVG